jgi:hypothetical protein
MDSQTREMLLNWAEYAAGPFQGSPREEVEAKLKLTMGQALRMGIRAVPKLEGAKIAYIWDENDKISVILDIDKMTDDMLVIMS